MYTCASGIQLHLFSHRMNLPELLCVHMFRLTPQYPALISTSINCLLPSLHLPWFLNFLSPHLHTSSLSLTEQDSTITSLSSNWISFYSPYQSFQSWLRNMDTEMSYINPFVNDMAAVRVQLEKQKVWTQNTCICRIAATHLMLLHGMIMIGVNSLLKLHWAKKSIFSPSHSLSPPPPLTFRPPPFSPSQQEIHQELNSRESALDSIRSNANMLLQGTGGSHVNAATINSKLDNIARKWDHLQMLAQERYTM